MKKKSIIQFQIFSVIFTFILGTLLHFVYQWSGENLMIAAFSAVNESTWEHLKLAFYPMLFTTIIGLFFFQKEIPNYLCAKTLGILTAISFITIFFYTYTGILGTNLAILDIGSFFVAVILGEWVAYEEMKKESSCPKKIASSILISLLVCFIFFTYCPPEINYFKDPVTNSYGIPK